MALVAARKTLAETGPDPLAGRNPSAIERLWSRHEKPWRKLDLIRSREEILRQLNGFGRGTKKPSN